MEATNAATALGFSMDDTMAISGRLAPVPPINKAIAAPMLMPFPIRTLSRGMAISMRKYKGTPITDANRMASGLSLPRYFSTNASGTNEADMALITAPINT